jgi:hydroxymethylbilane synthase
LFLKELEQALLNGRVDIAVHSMKDVTVSLPDGLHIPVICERGDPHDAFVPAATVSCASYRPELWWAPVACGRQALLRYRFPELNVVNLRGNVNTRLQRLDDGDSTPSFLPRPGCSAWR